jgi:hypothetical protein
MNIMYGVFLVGIFAGAWFLGNAKVNCERSGGVLVCGVMQFECVKPIR